LYNFPYIPKSELKEMYKRSHDREYGIPNLFNSIHLPKVNRSNSIDKRGFQLQKDAITIANQAAMVHKSIF
jgi:hypothetical protein